MFSYPYNSDILETEIQVSSISELSEQKNKFVFWEKLWLNNFVQRSTDLQFELLTLMNLIFSLVETAGRKIQFKLRKINSLNSIFQNRECQKKQINITSFDQKLFKWLNSNDFFSA